MVWLVRSCARAWRVARRRSASASPAAVALIRAVSALTAARRAAASARLAAMSAEDGDGEPAPTTSVAAARAAVSEQRPSVQWRTRKAGDPSGPAGKSLLL